jgi:hypothetical protein
LGASSFDYAYRWARSPSRHDERRRTCERNAYRFRVFAEKTPPLGIVVAHAMSVIILAYGILGGHLASGAAYFLRVKGTL